MNVLRKELQSGLIAQPLFSRRFLSLPACHNMVIHSKACLTAAASLTLMAMALRINDQSWARDLYRRMPQLSQIQTFYRPETLKPNPILITCCLLTHPLLTPIVIYYLADPEFFQFNLLEAYRVYAMICLVTISFVVLYLISIIITIRGLCYLVTAKWPTWEHMLGSIIADKPGANILSSALAHHQRDILRCSPSQRRTARLQLIVLLSQIIGELILTQLQTAALWPVKISQQLFDQFFPPSR